MEPVSACLLHVGGAQGAGLSPLLSWWGALAGVTSPGPRGQQPPPYSLILSELQACISSFQELPEHLELNMLSH